MDMRERPILFSAEMVRAIFDERKTQTRRVIKPQPNDLLPRTHFFRDNLLIEYMDSQVMKTWKCPYGKPGDRLWVRERTRLIECLDVPWVSGINGNDKGRFRYEADGTETNWIEYPSRLALLQKDYCVPNGCYREASRINLEITDIRVERVQEITPEDALAEGVKWDGMYEHPKDNFIKLWDSINAKRGYGWDTNCWVWVITFKQINA
jgi:hypothetical protein